MAKRTMTRAECEAFLAETRVGVLTVDEPGRGPCTTPLWYRYEPGAPIRITVPPTSRKVALLRKTGRASLCVQQDALPYRYVVVEGPTELLEVNVEDDQREIACRYLGRKLGERYLAANAEGLSHEILLLLRPVHWRSVDFSKLRI
jgi:nitroimidazol reductase NimA-like FMN-containing flavoprotein (pyridoxamine 5'-phosphate oxidase superfamily)